VALNGKRIIHFSVEKGMGIIRQGQVLSYIIEIVSVFRRVEFVSDRMSYTILRDRCCNIIVLNMHAQCEYKWDDIKDRFYKELGRVFDQFRRYDTKIL
jgi:hypothetical protein